MINSLDLNKVEYIKDFLDNASMYYYTGTPIISDEQFDHLADLINYKAVGHKVSSDTKKHYKRMYSQQKYYAGEGVAPFSDYTGPKIETPKLDGAAISLLYLDGNLIQALTRGDGIEGRDITSKLLNTKNVLVPKVLKQTIEGLIQVTGEITAFKDIENSRNYASGALGLLDQVEFDSRELFFTAYDTSYQTETYSNDLNELKKLGFKTVLDEDWCSQFPTDGTVIRINNNKLYEELGYTSKHPRGAYALKLRKAGVITKLLDVVWQTGKSGKVTPVAVLEPCTIGGALVSRATLNNIAFIRALDLDIGCLVEVQRSGEIIPTIIRRVSEN